MADSGSSDAIHQQISAEQHPIPVSMSFAIQQSNLGRRAESEAISKAQEQFRSGEKSGTRVTEMTTQSENLRNGKRGDVPERSSKHKSMFFPCVPPIESFPAFVAATSYALHLC